MKGKTNKSNGVVIAIIIGACMIVSFSVLAYVWQKNSKDISDRQLQELQVELEQQKLLLEKENSKDSENEEKRQKYLECVAKGVELNPKISTSDLEMLRTVCKDYSGFQE